MARKPEGFTLHRDKRTRSWIVRFTHNGQRYKRSTRECDRGSAQKIASEIVGEVTQGDRVGNRRGGDAGSCRQRRACVQRRP